MNSKLLGIVANIAAIVGVLTCGAAGIGRIMGLFHILGFQSGTLFISGISLMVLAVLVKLYRIEAMLADRTT